MIISIIADAHQLKCASKRDTVVSGNIPGLEYAEPPNCVVIMHISGCTTGQLALHVTLMSTKYKFWWLTYTSRDAHASSIT